MKQRSEISVPRCSECDGKDRNNLFCNLSSQELESLSEDKGDNFYKKGQVIFYEGNRGHGLFCIYKGKVKIHKYGEEGKEQIVRFAKEGEILGYRSLLGNEPFNATATAIEDSLICYLPKSKFMELLENNSDFALKTIRLLTKDLRESEMKLIGVTQKSVKERIAEAILTLINKFGLRRDGKTLEVKLTRKEIGDLAGVTTETTIRVLSSLDKEGVICLNGKEIEIHDLEKLVVLAKVERLI